jgi:acyl-coenzyme A synthetase/AMP-(fatty) acid ligase
VWPVDPLGGWLACADRDESRAVDNLAFGLVERHRRLGRGAEPAILDDGGAWTFDELSRASARAAGALAARGVRAGDRVAVLMPDGRRAVQALLGTVRLGAVAVPLDPGMRPDRLRAVLDDCAPAAVVADEDLDGEPAAPAPVGAGEVAVLIYTSGTTGRPKGVAHAHGALAAPRPSFLRDVAGVGPGDRCFAAARWSTALGFFIGLARPLAAGAAAVLSAPPATARRTLAAAAQHRVTVLAAVPTLWLQLAAILGRRGHEVARLDSVRLAISSGDRLPPGVAGRIGSLGGPALVDGLGSSECGDIVLAGPADGGFRQVPPGVEVRVADRAGAPVPEGSPGLLWVRTPSATPGYWRRDDLTRELRVGPWVRTEDVVARRGGALRHLGRADDLFKVDGCLVSPGDIESALAEHPRVAEAAVVGAPQGGGLVRPAAFVVPTGDAGARPALARELRRHVARRLAPALAPARVVLTDALPRLASGKLDRGALRAAA